MILGVQPVTVKAWRGEIQNITVLIAGTPEVDLLSVDLQEQLIHVPDVAQSALLLLGRAGVCRLSSAVLAPEAPVDNTLKTWTGESRRLVPSTRSPGCFQELPPRAARGRVVTLKSSRDFGLTARRQTLSSITR